MNAKNAPKNDDAAPITNSGFLIISINALRISIQFNYTHEFTGGTVQIFQKHPALGMA